VLDGGLVGRRRVLDGGGHEVLLRTLRDDVAVDDDVWFRAVMGVIVVKVGVEFGAAGGGDVIELFSEME
jgi:hypothetical protein